MRELNIGPAAAFADPGRKVIEADGVEVGVFKVDGEFYAYQNICPHSGGPACQGKMIYKVEELIAGHGVSKGLVFSKTQLNVTCPWHGYEFDIRSGRHQGEDSVRLAAVTVRIESGNVIVTMPRPAASL